MRVQDYTDALLALIQEGNDISSLLPRLEATLAAHGHSQLYPRILRNAAAVLERGDRRRATITLAKESDGSAHQSAIVEALTTLGVTEYTTEIDPTIVGGFVAEKESARIDASYKKALLTLYRSLIT